MKGFFSVIALIVISLFVSYWLGLQAEIENPEGILLYTSPADGSRVELSPAFPVGFSTGGIVSVCVYGIAALMAVIFSQLKLLKKLLVFQNAGMFFSIFSASDCDYFALRALSELRGDLAPFFDME